MGTTQTEITDRKTFRQRVFLEEVVDRKSARRPDQFGLMREKSVFREN